MSIFEKYDLHEVDESFAIPEKPETGLTLLVGSSGSGKSTILKEWGLEENVLQEFVPLHEMFSNELACEKLLTACGLRTIPAWLRPLSQLSNGERHRAEIALSMDKGQTVFDEFSSVVDRNTARSLSVAMRRHYDQEQLESMIFATCHRDVIDWLLPCNIYDTDKREWVKKKIDPFSGYLFHLKSDPPISKIGFVSKSITI
jgi:ABC-type ATPase with predicted acetyltransferase domain